MTSMGRRPIFGNRPPSYVSKATLAAELDMSESTIDAYVQRGLLPPPIRFGGSVRWAWAEVMACLSSRSGGEDDPYITGVDNV